MGCLRIALVMLAVGIVALTAIAAFGLFFLESMTNHPPKSVNPFFVIYGLAGFAVIVLLSRRELPMPVIIISCAWAAPAIWVILRTLTKAFLK